jgi:NADH-quinone oxidoreductase subunit C
MAETKTDNMKNQTHLLEIERLLKGAYGQSVVSSEIKEDELIVTIDPAIVAEVMKWFKNERACSFDYVRCLCGVDYPEHITIVYHLFATTTRSKLTVKAEVPKNRPVLASVTGVWTGADWHEREAAEMFGLTFEGHPDPRKLLLTDDNDDMPLRKDFKLKYESDK